MDKIASLATNKAISVFMDWGTAKINSHKKQQAIKELLEATTKRAAMTASSVNLATKFKDIRLVEEMLAHHELEDIPKATAIATFLGSEADDEAIAFVGQFYDEVTRIMATADESLANRKTLEVAEETKECVKALHAKFDAVGLGEKTPVHSSAIRHQKSSDVKKPIIPEEIAREEMPYVQALMRIYGEIERIDNFELSNFDRHSSHKRHFQRQRKDYYSAEFVRRCMRDSYVDEGENQFETLEDEVYAGVIDVYEDDYENGKKRLGSVLKQAALTPVDKCWISRDTDWIGISEKKGVCHILVNNERIKGWLNEDQER